MSLISFLRHAGWRAPSILRNYLTVVSDLQSVMTVRLLSRSMNELRDGRTAAIRIRALGGRPILCRLGTHDVDVVWNTFYRGYAQPPANLGEIHTILDLGSNIGTSIAHLAVLHPRARILGVELAPDNFQLCELNIAPYRHQCSVLMGAAWTHNTCVSIAGTETWSYRAVDAIAGAPAVPAYRMDDLIERLGGHVDYVKMDIMGAERPILKQGGDWLSKVRCLKVRLVAPYTTEQCARDLSRHGFACTTDSRHPRCVIATRS